MPNTASRAAAVRAAATLFQQQGYAATGLAQVIEASHTPRGSFYFNFPGGKQELAVAALELSGAGLRDGIEALARAAAGPGEFLCSLASTLAAAMDASDYSLGCPIATVALETACSSALLREAADRQFTGWEEAIARGLTPYGEPGERERRLAGEALMLIEGALIMARVRRTSDPMRGLSAVFERLSTGERRPEAER